MAIGSGPGRNKGKIPNMGEGGFLEGHSRPFMDGGGSIIVRKKVGSEKTAEKKRGKEKTSEWSRGGVRRGSRTRGKWPMGKRNLFWNPPAGKKPLRDPEKDNLTRKKKERRKGD